MSTLNFEPFARIEQLETRIEELEAALREIIKVEECARDNDITRYVRKTARAALDKDVEK